MKIIVDIIFLFFYIFIVMVGVLGNVLFIVVVRKYCFMYIIINFLLINIVVFDIIFLVFFVLGMVFCFFEYLSGNFGSFFCKFVIMYYVVGIFLLVLGLIFIFILVERYNVFF